MKKALAFKLMVDPKDVRRALALITGDSISEEELDAKFFNREPMEVSFPAEDRNEEFQMTAAFVALMIINLEEKK